MPVYFRGSTHWLTKAEADERYPEDDLNEHHQHQDGTWSVYHLSRTPLEPNQVEWQRSKRT